MKGKKDIMKENNRELVHNPSVGKCLIPMGWVYNGNGECSPKKMSESEFLELVKIKPNDKWIWSESKLSKKEIMKEYED